MPSLVLHGGGNTSVKRRVKNTLGEEVEVRLLLFIFLKSCCTTMISLVLGTFAPSDIHFWTVDVIS